MKEKEYIYLLGLKEAEIFVLKQQIKLLKAKLDDQNKRNEVKETQGVLS